MLLRLTLLVMNCAYICVFGFANSSVKIAIFLDRGENTGLIKSTVKEAIDSINTRTKFKVSASIIEVSRENVYEAGKQACELVQQGIGAFFGPDSPELNEIIQSISSTLKIPHFQTFWNLRPTQISSLTFNLHPTSHSLSQALATLVRDNDWKTYTVIYENEEGLLRLRESIKHRKLLDVSISFKKLGNGPDYRSILKEIKNSGESRFILDCRNDLILEVLRQAKHVKLLEDYHSYILTDLDSHSLDWSEFAGTLTNITSIRLLDPSKIPVSKKSRIDLNKMKTRTALVYDAINIFMSAFVYISQKEPIDIQKLSCKDNTVSGHGERFYEVIKKIPSKNLKMILPTFLSGPVFFHPDGRRRDFNLQIVEMTKHEGTFRITGNWNSENPNQISYTITSAEREEEMKKEIQTKRFKVVSRIGAPYLMKRTTEYGKFYHGNDRYEGYSLDLMREICNILNCSYTFELVPDNKYGNYDPVKKEWNGLIGYLLDRKADLAVCDLTITYERRRAVDFTLPFMTLGVSILYAKAVKEPPSLLSFSHPLSLEVWLYMATAYLLISMLIFLAARLNPNDWENPHPCEPNPEELENIWSIRNCCWLTLGSIMAQGCDLLPKGVSTRMATAAWWFFSLIMTASYTANLAAFLTMSRMGLSIESAEDLASQSKIKYGCVAGGSTCAFFRESNFSTYHTMWVQMESADPTVFEKNNEEGVKRVWTSKRKYAFLMESTNIEYETERNCDLIQVGGQLDSKGYGIAMKADFQYGKSFNEAILKMQEMGILQRLKKKWWEEMYGGGRCKTEETTEDDAATELGLDHVGGVFVVLGAGVALAFIFAIFEFLWMVKKLAVKDHLKFREVLLDELNFARNIWARQKSVKKEKSNLVKNDSKDK